MSNTKPKIRFKAKLLRPAKPGTGETWTFVVLPKDVSDSLPRRGRTTVEGSINGHPFSATLEPDGQLSHWLRVDETLRKTAGANVGDSVLMEIGPAEQEAEPALPEDLREALADQPEAHATWSATTTLARVDWVHWIESAKQQKTRAKRVANACDMLASGKKRVCCFDQSGHYDKSLCAPAAAD